MRNIRTLGLALFRLVSARLWLRLNLYPVPPTVVGGESYFRRARPQVVGSAAGGSYFTNKKQPLSSRCWRIAGEYSIFLPPPRAYRYINLLISRRNAGKGCEIIALLNKTKRASAAAAAAASHRLAVIRSRPTTYFGKSDALSATLVVSVADSLVTFAGERWDFVLDADREVGNYWMKFKGLQNCGDEFYGAFNVAILHYEGADDTPPEADVTYESIVSKGVQANPVNVPSADRSTLTISELKSVSKERDPALGDDPIRLIFYFDFYAIDNPIYHKANLYGYFDVPVEYRVRTQQINRISMKMPSFALLSQGENVKPDTFCNARRLDDCENEFCWCTHVEMLPLFRVVEIVLVDEGMPYTSNHPFHLHGYSFRVIATEKIGENTSAETVMRKLAANEIAINLRDPVFKDTVTVPRGGFTMVRIYLDNPGYWLLHCHLEFHSENGMAVVLKVGDYPDFPPVPENFPQCGDYWG